MTSLRGILDNDKVKLTDGVKKQVLEELLPLVTKADAGYVNGDIKGRAQ